MNNKRGNIARFMNTSAWILITLLLIYVLMKSSIVFSSANMRQTISNLGDEIVSDFSNQVIISNSPILQYVSATNSNGNGQSQLTKFVNNVFPINHYSLVAFKENIKKENDAYLTQSASNFINYNPTDLENVFKENQQSEDSEYVEDAMTDNMNTEISFIRGETYLEDVSTQFSEESKAILANNYKIITKLKSTKDFEYLINNFYIVNSSTDAIKQLFDVSKLLKKDMTLKQTNDKPQILICHTHSQEAFINSKKNDPNDTIVGVGTYLYEILTEQYGYSVIHDTTTYDLMNGVFDRNKAYDYALDGVQEILNKNPSIEVIIDLHRDEGVKRVTYIGGKPTAQPMFFNGLSRNKQGPIEYLKNPYISDNLAFSLQLQIKSLIEYPNFTKKIFLKGYRYNQHLLPKSLLIELGTQNNTVAEAKNAMEPLANILNQVLEGK